MAAELLLTKIFELNPKDSLSENVKYDVNLDWLPVTSLGVNNRRVTVRLPYPRGDFDINYVHEDDGTVHANSECEICNGTGVVNGEQCPVCDGTGSVGAGAITIEDGVVSLRIDDASLGYTADGKLYARSKVAEKCGLAVNSDDQIYISLDDDTLGINEDGQLYVKPTKTYICTKRITSQTVPPGALEIPIISGTVPDDVDHVKVHIGLDLIPRDYLKSNKMSLFVIEVGGVDSDVYTWDQTIPYTIINYTTLVDTTTLKDLSIKLKIHAPDNEAFPTGMTFHSTVTVMQVDKFDVI